MHMIGQLKWSMRKYIWKQGRNLAKNNTPELYFILGRSGLHWNFSSIPRMAMIFSECRGHPLMNWKIPNIFSHGPS